MIDLLLWAAAILTFGVGDSITTYLGVRGDLDREANPVVRRIIGKWGWAGFATAKVVAFAAAGLLWWLSPVGWIVPAVLALAGGWVTQHNWRIIE